MSLVPSIKVCERPLLVSIASGAWVAGTVRYMAVTPVSMSKVPQAAGVTALTEMQTGVASQSSSARASLT